MGTTILEIGQFLFNAYYWLIIISILASWIPPFQSSKVGEWITSLVEPYLSIFRRFIPPLGMIDISPIIAIFVYRYITAFALEGLKQVLNVVGL